MSKDSGPLPGQAPEASPAIDVLPVASMPSGRGSIDWYGYHHPSLAWKFCGWITAGQTEIDVYPAVTVEFEHGQISGAALLGTFPREDVVGIGVGVVLHLAAPPERLGKVVSLALHAHEGCSWTVTPADSVQLFRHSQLAARLRDVVAILDAGEVAAQFAEQMSRTRFTGANIIRELTDRVFLEIEAAILCPPDGLALVGWTWSEPGRVRAIRLRCGESTSELNLEDSVRTARADVLESLRAQVASDDFRPGFITFIPHGAPSDATMFAEVETASGEVVYRDVPRPTLTGMSAIKYVLDCMEVAYGTAAQTYDNVIGPIVSSLNIERLRAPRRFRVLDFGPPSLNPRISVVVPLYGRLEFMEYQFAMLTRGETSALELIYVLDDPQKEDPAARLAASVYERFRLPFRLVVLAENVGFGPANNVGLSLVRGEYVCFMNSDVFPGNDRWLGRLAERFAADGRLGAVGPMLLYEDDTVQHAGMVYERLPEFSNWHFPIHPGKGWRRAVAGGLVECPAITAACLMMRTAVAREVGGFDDAYVIGDFEDSDLCLKLGSRGLACAVDRDVHLYHLERQSQGSSASRWRMNLTLYNAWVHERRWGASLRDRAALATKETA